MSDDEKKVLGATLVALGERVGILPTPRTRPERACLNCGSPHRHANAYCSATCCAEYRAAKRKASVS